MSTTLLFIISIIEIKKRPLYQVYVEMAVILFAEEKNTTLLL